MSSEIPSNFLELLAAFDAPVRREIKLACETMEIAPGQMIYDQGSVSDGIYIVMAGEVEVLTYSPDRKQSRSVASMKRGDFFGDLAVFTGQPRMAMVRARDKVELLYIEQEKFLGLVRRIPELGFFFSRKLADRLHFTSSEAHLRVYLIDLSGNLGRFDLLTIVQAITSMGNSGELNLYSSAHHVLGSFFFRKGRVEHARFGHLVGLEAIWQGFIESASEGTFQFSMIEAPVVPFDETHRIRMESTNLLMEGVGKRDTYSALPEPLRLMKGRLTRQSSALEWKREETRAVAQGIWDLVVNEPQPLRTIWEKLNYSAITFLEVVMEMGMSSQVELFLDPAEAGPLF